MKQLLTIMLVSLVILALAPVARADIPFAGADALYQSIDGVASVATADFNRDGLMDFAVAATNNDEVSIRFSGSPLPPPLQLTTGLDQAHIVLAADLNGDGWLDVIAASYGPGSVGSSLRWWQNPGYTGGAWAARAVFSAINELRGVAVGDLDRDGDNDVVYTGKDDTHSYVVYAENDDGNGTSWDLVTISHLVTDPRGVAIADFNGDGDADVVVAVYTDNEVTFFENNGDGTVWTRHLVESDFGGAHGVTAADMDADGDQDIIASTWADDEVVWFENRLEDALGWSAHTLTSTLYGASSVQACDLDSDGDMDVLATGETADEVVWFENTGSSFSEHTIGTALSTVQSSVAVDFDSDGDLDVLSAVWLDDEVVWFENLSLHFTATFASRRTVDDSPYNPSSLDMGDIDQDGDIDIVGSLDNNNSMDPGIAVWHRNPLTLAWSGEYLDDDIRGAAKVRVTDLNADGRPDLVAAGSINNDIRWYEGEGDGVLTTHWVESNFPGVADLDVADIDCDADLDIVALSPSTGDVYWFENDNGIATAWTEHLIINLSGDPHALRVTDIGGDGDIDIVVARENHSWLRVLTNQTCGSTWNWLAIESPFSGMADVEVADLNNDGWPDLVTAAPDDDTVSAWIRDSSDWSWERYDVTTTFGAGSVSVADLDLDGDIDIAGTAQSAGDVKWWRNNGDGTSWYGFILDSSLTGANAVVAGDLDADGLPDVVAASSDGDLVGLYESEGGQFDSLTLDMAPSTILDLGTEPILRIYPRHRGLSSDLDLELRSIDIFLDSGSGDLSDAEARALINNIQVYADDGDGVFEVGDDIWLTVYTDIAGGWNTIPIQHGGLWGGNPRISRDDLQAFFLVVHTTADASAQSPRQFRISHWNLLTPLLYYYDYVTVPARPVRGVDSVVSSTVTCVHMLFTDGFESGDTSAWSTTVD